MDKRRKRLLFSKSFYAEQNFRVRTLIKEAPVSKNYFLSAIVPSKKINSYLSPETSSKQTIVDRVKRWVKSESMNERRFCQAVAYHLLKYMIITLDEEGAASSF